MRKRPSRQLGSKSQSQGQGRARVLQGEPGGRQVCREPEELEANNGRTESNAGLMDGSVSLPLCWA